MKMRDRILVALFVAQASITLFAFVWLCWKVLQNNTEQFESALSSQGQLIFDDVTTNLCRYGEEDVDYTGVMTAPSLLSDMWHADRSLLVTPDNQMRCYVSHQNYFNPANPSLPCDRNNQRLYKYDFDDLVKDIGIVDLGPGVGRHCAVTMQKGYTSRFQDYVEFIENNDPDRRTLIEERKTDLGIATTLQDNLIPAANDVLNEMVTRLQTVDMEVVNLNSTLASLNSQLGQLQGETEGIKAERENIIRQINEYNAALAQREAERNNLQEQVNNAQPKGKVKRRKPPKKRFKDMNKDEKIEFLQKKFNYYPKR